MREDGVHSDRAAVKFRPRPVYFDDGSVPKLLGGEVEKGHLFPVVDHEHAVFVRQGVSIYRWKRGHPSDGDRPACAG